MYFIGTSDGRNCQLVTQFSVERFRIVMTLARQLSNIRRTDRSISQRGALRGLAVDRRLPTEP
jgi:hypothetical protein